MPDASVQLQCSLMTCLFWCREKVRTCECLVVLWPREGDHERIQSRSLVLRFGFLASLAVAGGAAATPVLYVSQYDRVIAVDPDTYTTLGTAFADPALSYAEGLALGPNGHVYVMSEGTHAILEFDPANGQLVGTVVSGLPASEGGLNWRGSQLAFGPDGNLYWGRAAYASGAWQYEVRRYDAASGALLGTLPGVGPAFAFGSDGLLYGAASFGTEISRYDPVTLSFLDTFAISPLPSLSYFGQPYDSGGFTHLAFAPDGTLIAMNEGSFGYELAAAVSAYDPSGNLIDTTALAWDGYGRFDLAVHPTTGEILSLSDVTSVEVWSFGTANPVTTAGNLGWTSTEFLFVPEPALLAYLAILATALRRRV